MDSVYLETSIVSYLTARPSRDLVTAAHQELTREWWTEHRSSFDLVTSEIVLDEAAKGDEQAARRRLTVLRDIFLLDLLGEAEKLTQELLSRGPLPEKAALDAAHIALCAVHRVDYLLTWNCAHIANAVLRKPIERVCRSLGHDPPIMCTPEELMME